MFYLNATSSLAASKLYKLNKLYSTCCLNLCKNFPLSITEIIAKRNIFDHIFCLHLCSPIKTWYHLIYNTSSKLGTFLWLFTNVYDVINMTSSIWRHGFFILIICQKFSNFEKKWFMEANIITEINSVLNDKQNVEIRQIQWNGSHIFSAIYRMKMLIKVNQIHTVSFDIQALFLLVLSKLCIKYNKSYRSWQLLKLVIFYNFSNTFVPALWRHNCMTS